MATRTRGRGGRGAVVRASEEPSASETSMPPPATTRVTRSAQAQTREPDVQPEIAVRPLEIARRGTRREDREQSKASVASISSLRSGRTGTDVFQSQQSQEPQIPPSDISEETDVRDRETTAASVAETPAQQLATARVMNKFLDRLYTASEDLLNLFLDPKTAEDVWVAELEKVQAPFSAYRERYYVDGSPYFLDLEYVLRRLDCDEGSELGLLASRTIATENIVSFLTNVKVATLGGPESEVPLTMLQAMDNAFSKLPASLSASQLRSWGEQEEMTLFKLALDLRTQRFIATYRQFSAQNDPFGLLALVFCHPNAVGNTNDNTVLFGLLDRGPYAKLMGLDVNLTENLRKMYHGRINHISQMLKDEGADSFDLNMTRLETEFPFDEFVDDVEAWVSETFEKIDSARTGRRTSQQSPSLALRSREESQVDESIADTDVNSQPIIRAPPASSGPSLLSRDGVMALKQLESGANGDIPPSNQRAASRNPWQQSASPGRSNSGALYAESAANSTGKRPLEVDDDPLHFDDNDDEFETDNRAPNSQRRAQAPGRKQPSPKRVRIGSSTDMPPPPRPRVPSSSAPGRSASASSSAARAVLAPSQQNLHPPPPSTEPDLQQLSQMSRAISIASRKSKEPQRRQAWSRDDTRTLIRAVDAFDCKWSLIQKMIAQGKIAFEYPREQQALRDKARQVKVDFLKTDSILPPGFDGVVLGAKERKIVIDVGKNPDRKEADKDPETGLPTNTVYIEDPFA